MGKASLGLADLSLEEKLSLGLRVSSNLSNNPNYRDAAQLVTALNEVLASLSLARAGALARQQSAELAHEDLRRKEGEFDTVMSQVAGFVDVESQGDTSVILSAGVAAHPPQLPPAEWHGPAELSALPGEEEGTILLNWRPQSGATSYEVQRSFDAVSGWVHACSCTKCRVLVYGLAGGICYYFRVRAIGELGPGPWSGFADKIAP